MAYAAARAMPRGAPPSKLEDKLVGVGVYVNHSTAWFELKSGQFMQTVHHFVGENMVEYWEA